MKPKKRQKICYNCEKEVDLDVIVCPCCAADLRVEKPELQKQSYNPVINTQNMNTQESLYPNQTTRTEEAVVAQEVVAENGVTKNIFTATILLALGAQLLLFSLFMLFFSHKGVLLLQWDARFWSIYFIVSIPFLIFGYKTLSKQ